jgi:hypothetical protein
MPEANIEPDIDPWKMATFPPRKGKIRFKVEGNEVIADHVFKGSGTTKRSAGTMLAKALRRFGIDRPTTITISEIGKSSKQLTLARTLANAVSILGGTIIEGTLGGSGQFLWVKVWISYPGK